MYSNLYLEENHGRLFLEGLDSSLILHNMSTLLETLFGEEVVQKTVWELAMDRASSPNGFKEAIFKDCWDVVKGLH